MTRNYFFRIGLLFLLSSCESKLKETKPIVLGDPSTIVTESDTTYLRNFTNDISPVAKKSSESQITKMMVQVDSLKNTKKLEEETNAHAPINGFTINFAECSVVYNGLYAHALNESQDERKTNSVSYLKDAGELTDMKFQVNNLTEIKAEERITVQLAIVQGDEQFVLQDLGKFTTQWYPLAGNQNTFISAGTNSLQFTNVDNRKIKLALQQELTRKKKNKAEQDKWMSLVSSTNSYSEAPCKLIIRSAQWRIVGKVNNKRVQKLIQFDIAI